MLPFIPIIPRSTDVAELAAVSFFLHHWLCIKHRPIAFYLAVLDEFVALVIYLVLPCPGASLQRRKLVFAIFAVMDLSMASSFLYLDLNYKCKAAYLELSHGHERHLKTFTSPNDFRKCECSLQGWSCKCAEGRRLTNPGNLPAISLGIG